MSENECYGCDCDCDKKNELTFEKMEDIEQEILKKGKEYEMNREIISIFEMDGEEIELSILGEKEYHRCLGYKIGEGKIEIIDAGLNIEPFLDLLKDLNSTPGELMDYIEKNSFVYEHFVDKEKLSDDLLDIFKAYKRSAQENWEVDFLEKHAEKIERFEKESFLYKFRGESYVVENGNLVGKIDSKSKEDGYIPFSAAEFTRDMMKLRKYK